ncbi:DUF481 domain-containing protein [Melittangium boletus]|uniref:DUF481 domain-containing protein n=1 Tax=Melittangium boletus DSM 14713 TaxID=1294270 RepID=A0A250IQT4_9BACT|nr:DUF481 domain-containing protein [Melittangium boletus]ATB34115.1 hypothetical protein MEBOL_007616 [Melittangium boletus DSM 14713]
MLPVHTFLSAFLTFQTPPPPPPPAPPEVAAERAAAAAERAAAAAERSAQAIERLAQGITVAPPEEKKPEEKKPDAPTEGDNWNVTVGMGLIFITGNASTVTLNGLIAAERKTEGWIYAVKASGVYGQSRAPTLEGQEQAPDQVVALNAAVQLRGDRRFTERISGYLLAGAETDHVKSVEARGIGEGGVGVLWWDEQRSDGSNSFFRMDLALRYARETRFQYYPTRMDLPDVSLGGPRFGATFRHGVTKDISLLEEVSVLPSLIEGSRLLINNQTQLNVRLTRALSVTTTFLLQYDSEPAAGKFSTDTSLSVGATVTF